MTSYLGYRFGQYKLTRLIDRGGFADVYLGKHVHLRTYAAIKVLRTHLTYEEQQAFLQEARMMASLDHCHIVRILDYNIKFGTPYLIMDYAANGTLRQRHRQGEQLSLDTILDYLWPLADALDYIHELGLVHLDIKPENILLGKDGRVMLSDFGIALSEQQITSQETHTIAGTFAYIAPERVQGEISDVSDQYSLGIVVYEWLMGERPFQGTSRDVLWQHVNEAPPRMSTQFSHISPEIERVVFKALHKNPNRRYASVMDFVLALEQARLNTLALPRNQQASFFRRFFQ